jgi:hypothetical protein
MISCTGSPRPPPAVVVAGPAGGGEQRGRVGPGGRACSRSRAARGEREGVGGERVRGRGGADGVAVDEALEGLPDAGVGERAAVGAQRELGDDRLRRGLDPRRGCEPPSAVRTASRRGGQRDVDVADAQPSTSAFSSSRRRTSWSSTAGLSQYWSLRASTTSPRARSTGHDAERAAEAGRPLVSAPVHEPGASLSRCAGSRFANSVCQAG